MLIGLSGLIRMMPTRGVSMTAISSKCSMVAAQYCCRSCYREHAVRAWCTLIEAGAKYDPLEPGKAGSIDRGGCVNLLTPSRMVSKNAPGEAKNSCLVEI